MIDRTDTRDPLAVEREVCAAHAALFPAADASLVPRAFAWVTECFRGEHEDYQGVDVPYHDLEHTLQGTLCLARLLQGRHRVGAEPRLTRDAFELGLLAILFHDTGYLKRRDDVEGTGAKYTPVHERRSAEFATAFLGAKGWPDPPLRAIRNMIACTGLNTDPATIPFADASERVLGYAVGTADLLGQMAAPDYVDKLPLLYDEFVEAAPHASGASARMYDFASADALMRNTPSFWDNYVRPKLDGPFGGLYAYLNDPYPDGPNAYVHAIDANLARLRASPPSAGA